MLIANAARQVINLTECNTMSQADDCPRAQYVIETLNEPNGEQNGWDHCAEDAPVVQWAVYAFPATDHRSELVEWFTSRAAAQAWIDSQPE